MLPRSNSPPQSPRLRLANQAGGDGVRGDVGDTLLGVFIGDEPNDVARFGGPEILPLSLRRVDGLRRQTVQLAEELRQEAVRVAHDEVVVIGHDARGVEAHAGLLHREGEAVEKDLVRLGPRSQSERALVAAPGDEVGLVGDDSARVGHDDAAKAKRVPATGGGIVEGFGGRSRLGRKRRCPGQGRSGIPKLTGLGFSPSPYVEDLNQWQIDHGPVIKAWEPPAEE